jgi:hypothetical protein
MKQDRRMVAVHSDKTHPDEADKHDAVANETELA